MTVWRRVAYWIIKVTRAQVHASARAPAHTSKYVKRSAFPRQQRFPERASMLRYTYIMCLEFLRW